MTTKRTARPQHGAPAHARTDAASPLRDASATPDRGNAWAASTLHQGGAGSALGSGSLLGELLGVDTGPPVVDWRADAAPVGGAVPSGSWSSSPAMRNHCNARCHGPTEGPAAESWRGSLHFMQQWSAAQASYNRVSELAAQGGIASELGPSLKPWDPSAPMPWFDPDRKQQVRVKAGETVPSEGGRSDVDSAFDERGNVDAGRVDTRGTTDAQQTAWRDAKRKAVDARGVALEKKVSVDQALTGVSTAFSKVAQANIKVKQAEAQGEKQAAQGDRTSVTHAQKRIEGRVKAASSIFTGLIETAKGSKPGEAGKGAVKAIDGALTLAVSEYYGHRLSEIDRHIAALNTEISALSVDYEMEAVRQAVNAVSQAKGEVVKARVQLDAAIRAQNVAFDDLGREAARLAEAQGRSEEDQIVLRTAAAAIPHIEQVLSTLAQVKGLIRTPVYSRDSGLGAAQCGNLNEFTRHAGELAGFARELPTLEQTWSERLASARAVLGLALPSY